MFPTDILNLIFEYKRNFENLEELLREMNKCYNFLKGVKFDDFDDVLRFFLFISKDLENISLFHFSGGCNNCHETRSGYWSYTFGSQPENTTIGTILEFIRQTNQLCQHECVKEINLSSTCAYISLDLK